MSKESKDLAAKAQWDSKRVLSLVVNNALMIIMIIAAIAIAIVNPNFVSASSIVNIISQTAAYLPAALGIAGCIVLTGTDLSAGRAVGLTACISASLLQVAGSASKMWPNIGTLPIPVVILIAMAIGAVIGAFNGFFVGKFKLHPFIVTLGTQLILYTILLLYVKMGNNGGMAISNLDESYNSFVKGSILPKIAGQTIPNYVIFAILLTALMWFIWNKTTFGKNMFALGSNEEAARVSGVNVLMTTIMVFSLAGAMYGFTGFIEGARIGSNTANTGLNYELDAIAACVIGGVSMSGGSGKWYGVVIGSLMLSVISNGLDILRVNSNYQLIIKGIIIILAVLMDIKGKAKNH